MDTSSDHNIMYYTSISVWIAYMWSKQINKEKDKIISNTNIINL